jgi:hypothetical protein
MRLLVGPIRLLRHRIDHARAICAWSDPERVVRARWWRRSILGLPIIVDRERRSARAAVLRAEDAGLDARAAFARHSPAWRQVRAARTFDNEVVIEIVLHWYGLWRCRQRRGVGRP